MFCKFCGNELNENAVVCTKCGCAIPTNNKKEKKLPRNGDTVAESSVLIKTVTILSYVSIALITISFFFWCISVVDAHISTRIFHDIALDTTTAHSYFWLEDTYLVCLFVSSILTFLTSTANFIVGLLCKDSNVSFKSNVVFIISTILLVLAILSFMIL